MNRTLAITIAAVGGVLLVALLIAGWGISAYNRMVTAEESVKTGWSQVDNQYQRRYDLIPNLVETVKGVAKQEQTVLENVTKARASAMSAQGSTLDKACGENMLSGALKTLFAV